MKLQEYKMHGKLEQISMIAFCAWSYAHDAQEGMHERFGRCSPNLGRQQLPFLDTHYDLEQGLD